MHSPGSALNSFTHPSAICKMKKRDASCLKMVPSFTHGMVFVLLAVPAVRTAGGAAAARTGGGRERGGGRRVGRADLLPTEWCASAQCTPRRRRLTRARHANLAAVAPISPVSRPSFCRVPPGMRSIHPLKWQGGTRQHDGLETGLMGATAARLAWKHESSSGLAGLAVQSVAQRLAGSSDLGMARRATRVCVCVCVSDAIRPLAFTGRMPVPWNPMLIEPVQNPGTFTFEIAPRPLASSPVAQPALWVVVYPGVSHTQRAHNRRLQRRRVSPATILSAPPMLLPRTWPAFASVSPRHPPHLPCS